MTPPGRAGTSKRRYARISGDRSAFNVDSPDAYETLILDALQGDASLFTRADEVEEAWDIVDPVISGWADLPAPDFPNYEAGTWGPSEADKLPARDGRRWRRF